MHQPVVLITDLVYIIVFEHLVHSVVSAAVECASLAAMSVLLNFTTHSIYAILLWSPTIHHRYVNKLMMGRALISLTIQFFCGRELTI